MPISPQPLIESFPNFENNLPPYFLFSKQNFRTICACTHARGAPSMIVHAQTLHEHNHSHSITHVGMDMSESSGKLVWRTKDMLVA